MKVIIYIYPKKDVLDPEAETINKSLKTLGFKNFKNLSLGKKITYFTDIENKEIINKQTTEMCKKLLVNNVIEDYEVIIDNEVNS